MINIKTQEKITFYCYKLLLEKSFMPLLNEEILHMSSLFYLCLPLSHEQELSANIYVIAMFFANVATSFINCVLFNIVLLAVKIQNTIDLKNSKLH